MYASRALPDDWFRHDVRYSVKSGGGTVHVVVDGVPYARKTRYCAGVMKCFIDDCQYATHGQIPKGSHRANHCEEHEVGLLVYKVLNGRLRALQNVTFDPLTLYQRAPLTVISRSWCISQCPFSECGCHGALFHCVLSHSAAFTVHSFTMLCYSRAQ